jgi:hypothetical protein
MARTKNPHQAAIKSWETRRKAGGPQQMWNDWVAREEDYYKQDKPGGRAKGGKRTVGLNSEDYKGGQFLPHGDIPKHERRRRQRILAGSKAAQIEPSTTSVNGWGIGGERVAPPLPGLKPLLELLPANPRVVERWRDSPEGQQALRLLERSPLYKVWKAGARWINQVDWEERAPYYDADGKPVWS